MCGSLLQSDVFAFELQDAFVFLFALTWATFCAQGLKREPGHVQQTKWSSSLPNDRLYLAFIWMDSWARCNLTWNKVVAGLQLSILPHVEILWKAKGRVVENRKKLNLTSRTGGGTMYQAPNVLRQTWQAFYSWLNIAFFFSVYGQWKNGTFVGTWCKPQNKITGNGKSQETRTCWLLHMLFM